MTRSVLICSLFVLLSFSVKSAARAQSIVCHVSDLSRITLADLFPGYQHNLLIEADGDTVVVRDPGPGGYPLCIFRRLDNDLFLEAQIYSDDTLFGYAVDVDQDRVFVLSPNDPHSQDGPSAAIFVYERGSAHWHQSHRIAIPQLVGGSMIFSSDLDADGLRVVLSDGPNVVFFRYVAARWRVDYHYVRQGDPEPGDSVALSGNTVAFLSDDGGTDPLADTTQIEVWNADGGNWSRTAFLPAVGKPHLTLDGGFLSAIGSGRDVTMFRFDGTRWITNQIAPTGWTQAVGRESDVAFSYPYLAAASSTNNEVLIYKDNQSVPRRWDRIGRLRGVDVGSTTLGLSVAFSELDFIAISQSRSSDALKSGVHCLECLVDFDQDSAYSAADAQLFLLAFHAAVPEADLDDNGAVNFFDVAHFLRLYSNGCPPVK